MNKINLPADYKPSNDEEYMNPMQLEYFKLKLNEWRQDLLDESRQTMEDLKKENWNEADINDRATIETDATFKLKTRNRYRKLISKIEAALERIGSSEYGYCLETGEEIGIGRLEARPIATLTVEAQERYESYERQHSEDE